MYVPTDKITASNKFKSFDSLDDARLNKVQGRLESCTMNKLVVVYFD